MVFRGSTPQFKPDIIEYYGISGEISCSYYDPAQSLYLAGTKQGIVKVYGKSGCQHTYTVEAREQITSVYLCKTVYLLAIDATNSLTVWDISTNEIWAHYHFPSPAISHYADPAMEWLFIGQKNGQTSCYDIDRGVMSHFLIDNIQLQLVPAARLGAVHSVQVHPRDVSQVLLCYSDMFVVFSVVTNAILFHSKSPKLKFAKWSPSGTHILTGCEGTLSFWDGYNGKFLSTRSTPYTTQPLWCCGGSPDDTFLVYAKHHQLVKVKFGVTPTYSLTSWDAFGKFFAKPAEHELELGSPIEEITPMSETAYFGGGHNPKYFVARLEGGNLVPINTSRWTLTLACIVLPAPLCFSAGNISAITVSSISRLTWAGIMVSSPKPVIQGGVPPLSNTRLSTISLTATGYMDGSIRIFSEVTSDDTRVVETSIAEASPGPVTFLSISEDGAELAAGTYSGAVVLLGYQRNTHGIENMSLASSEITNVAHTASPELKEGYLPIWLVRPRGSETLTALCQSDLGFVAMGYSSTRVAVVDKRGPALILDEECGATPTKIAFGIQEFQHDGYSSILMSVGLSDGRVLLYKVLPRPGGGFQIARCSSYSLGNSPVVSLAHVDLSNGRKAVASREIMAQLSQGIRINGGLLASNSDDARLFGITGTKPKLAHKRLDKVAGSAYACLKPNEAHGLVTVSQRAKVTLYSLQLSSQFSYELPQLPIGQPLVSLNGNILCPLTDRFYSLVRLWGVGSSPQESQMYSSSKKLPMRPEISGAEWVSGRQYVKMADFDELIGGGRRPKSRKERKVFMDGQPQVARAKAPSEKAGWFEQAHPHSYASSTPTQSKTWGQTFEGYYDSAAEAVNNVMDETIDSVKTTQKNATTGIAKSLIARKFGL